MIDDINKISSPILGLWGDADAAVGIENVQRFTEEMRRLNKDCEVAIYPGAGRGFMAVRAEADAAAAADAWPKTLQFFDKHLRGAAVGA